MTKAELDRAISQALRSLYPAMQGESYRSYGERVGHAIRRELLPLVERPKPEPRGDFAIPPDDVLEALRREYPINVTTADLRESFYAREFQDWLTDVRSFAGLVRFVKATLDTHYSEEIPMLSSIDSPDPGPRFVWHLRQALAQLPEGWDS